MTWDTKERLDGWPIGEFAESRAPLNRNLTSKVYLGEDGFVYTGYIGMGVDRIVGRFDVELPIIRRSSMDTCADCCYSCAPVLVRPILLYKAPLPIMR